jgi:hypothetical protein
VAQRVSRSIVAVIDVGNLLITSPAILHACTVQPLLAGKPDPAFFQVSMAIRGV